MMRGAKTRTPGDRALRFSRILFAIGALAVALVVGVWAWTAGPESIRRGLDTAEPWFALWRLFLFVVLIGGWRLWSRLLIRWAGQDEARYRFMVSQRWRVAAWLLVFEALVVQNVAGKFILNLTGL